MIVALFQKGVSFFQAVNIAISSFSDFLKSSECHGINGYWSVSFEKVREVEDPLFAERIVISNQPVDFISPTAKQHRI
jgi:hypothetical protein